MSRLLLQICTALLALIPIATGIVTMLGVKDPLYRPLRLPQAPGPPPKPFVGFIILEIVGAPLFIYWQYRLAQSMATP